MNKAVVDTFYKDSRVLYAKHENGSIYVGNGHYIAKMSISDFGGLLVALHKRKRTADIAIVETDRVLDAVSKANGTFELTKPPYVLQEKACLYADEKQYFMYDKKYMDIFSDGENRLYVDDNASYDIMSHNLIIRNGGEVAGIVMPLRFSEELYAQLADKVPLAVKRKSVIERIKENPANDPYIGKEFFDGREHLIVAARRDHGGKDMYFVHSVEIESGILSRSAAMVPVDKMEEQIGLWDSARVNAEQRRFEDEKRAQKEAGVKAEYGKHLMEHAPAKESIKEQYEKAAKQAAAHNANAAPKRGGKAKGAEL